MADDQGLQGPHSHLAPGRRGRPKSSPPTDLPPCHQHPGDSEKLLDHQESTQILGLECPHQDLGLRLQLKSGGCLLKLFTSTWEMKRPLERGLYVSSKRLSMLLISGTFRGSSWRRLRDPFEKTHPASRTTPQPLCATGASLLHLPFEKCGVTSTSGSSKHQISPPARISCEDY